MNRASLLLWAAFAGCARAHTPDASPPPTASAASPAPSASVATADAAPAPPAATAEAHDAALEGGATSTEAEDLPTGGLDFIEQTKVLFRVATCGGEGEIPARFDPAVVTKHCEDLTRAYDEYKKSWVDVAEPFIAALEPKDLPTQVVYPFGGGDLVSALATFQNARELTTLSLEPAGDVRLIDKLAPEHLGRELAAHRSHLERLMEKAHSRTDNLEKEAQSELPGEIVFALAALVIHGAEPVGLRYFRIGSGGTVEYVTQADIDAQAHHPKAQKALFDNVELRFRMKGDKAVRVLRHVAYNLDDEHLKGAPDLVAHLSAKGKVAAMTKAASHLLWNDHFSLIRGWLIDHTDWMISDSTGIPPRYAAPAGYTQDTYGKFTGPAPFGLFDAKDASDFKRLFESEPARELPFRYGYPDKDGHAHLIVTHRDTTRAGEHGT